MFAGLDDRHPVRPVNLNLGFRVRIFNLLIYVPIPSTAMFLMHARRLFTHGGICKVSTLGNNRGHEGTPIRNETWVVTNSRVENIFLPHLLQDGNPTLMPD